MVLGLNTITRSLYLLKFCEKSSKQKQLKKLKILLIQNQFGSAILILLWISCPHTISNLYLPVGNPRSSVCDSVGFPLIPPHLTKLDDKECYSSHLNLGWHGFISGFSSIPSLAQMRRVSHSTWSNKSYLEASYSIELP